MMYRTDMGGPEFVRTLKILPDPGSAPADLYEKAEREVRAVIRSGWKMQPGSDQAFSDDRNDAQLPNDQAFNNSDFMYNGNAMTVLVRYSTMQQWVETRQAMRRIQGISDMRVKSVTPREAQVELQFSGDENRLRMAMAQAGMVLGPPQAEREQAAYGYGPPVMYEVYLKKYARSD